MSTLDAALRRWEAANQLIHASDEMRLLAGCGRAHQADRDRLREARERWEAEQHRHRAREAEAAGCRPVVDGPAL